MPEEITALLQAARDGDGAALDLAFERVYAELRSVARAQLKRAPGRSLDTTSLIHDAYLKLAAHERIGARDRSHFLALSARAMRQILVDAFRHRSAAKRGGGEAAVPLIDGLDAASEPGSQVLELSDALDRLAHHDRRLSRVVECKFFGGMSYEEIGQALDVAPRTARRDWFKAKAWLSTEMGPEAEAT